MITVKFYAGLRKIVGAREISLEADSLRAALDILSASYPGFQQEVWDGTVLRPQIVLTLNGQVIDTPTGLNLALKPDDSLAIFPPISGG